MKLGNTGYTLLEELNISDLENYKEHRRLRVFWQKGLRCCVEGCDRVASRLIVGLDKSGNKHVDLYTDDLVLMNVDHHMPVSLGGSNHIDNLFPMCQPHNSKKGNGLVNSNHNKLSKEEKRIIRYARRWRKFVRKWCTFIPSNNPIVFNYPKIAISGFHLLDEKMSSKEE